MRTTIDLPDDLHKQAQAIARDTRRTLSETVADLMRRGLGAASTTAISIDPRTGLPLIHVGTVVTSGDVRSLEDGEVTALLDANVLIALVVAEHVHHDAAAEWVSASDAGAGRNSQPTV